MPNVTTTIRQVKNLASGLDLTIPSYTDKAELFRNVLHCNIVAVTRLACFKLPHHKDSDVVQFTVTKQLDDFEGFRRKLMAAFPGTVVPALPKSLLSFVEGSIKEQISQLSEFLQFVAVTPKVASCAETLMFLGFSSVNAGRTEMGKTKSSPASIFEEESENAVLGRALFSGSDDEEDDLFTAPPNHQATHQPASSALRLFDDQDYGGEVARDDELVQIAGVIDVQDSHQGTLSVNKAEEDLLRIEDDLDEILKLKPKDPPKPRNTVQEHSTKLPTRSSTNKPALAPKPQNKPKLAPKPKKSPLTTISADKQSSKPESSSGNDSGVDTDDILRYIRDNSSQNDDDLDLFS